MCNLLHLVYITLVLIISTDRTWGGRPPPPTVEIKKCCKLNEYLDQRKDCHSGNTDKWVPKVFLIGRKTVFEPVGEAPRFFRFNENQLPQTCSSPELFTSSKNIIISSNGTLFLQEKSLIIENDDFCVDKDSALVCFPEVPGINSLVDLKNLTKVRKCCGPNYVYNRDQKTCFLNKNHNNATTSGSDVSKSIVNSSNVEILFGFPECDMDTTDYAITGEFRNDFLNDKTGSLTVDTGKIFQSKDFCLEHTISDYAELGKETSSDFVSMFVCSNHEQFSKDQVQNAYVPDKRIAIISICLLISVLFLAATLVAGFLMPTNHHALHWRCQMYYVSCLLIGDFLLAIGQIFGGMIHGGACVAIAIFMHFFFLAAFFWLNIMCVNIWWTFRDFRPTTLEKNQENLRFIIYSIYAWGGPLLIAGIAAILDHLPQDPNYNFLRPRFGELRCWFYGNKAMLAYFFGPIGILLLINLVLFASTAQQLTCGLWKMDEVKSTNERSALGRVCLKLVIVMGVTWIADVISWGVGGPKSLWYISDFINALQGVFIFIVVACQPQVWSAIVRIWSLKTVRGVTQTNMTGQQHSNSSHGLPSIGETITNNTITNPATTKIPLESFH